MVMVRIRCRIGLLAAGFDRFFRGLCLDQSFATADQVGTPRLDQRFSHLASFIARNLDHSRSLGFIAHA